MTLKYSEKPDPGLDFPPYTPPIGWDVAVQLHYDATDDEDDRDRISWLREHCKYSWRRLGTHWWVVEFEDKQDAAFYKLVWVE